MIKVNYKPQAYTLIIEGHAGSAEKGHDLVCAAVSALSYTLEAHCAYREEFHAKFRRSNEDALFSCRCYPEFIGKHDCLEMLNTIADGLKLMGEKYPEYIFYKEGRTNNDADS